MATLEDNKEVNRPDLRDNITRLIISYNEMKADRSLLLSRIESLQNEVDACKAEMRDLRSKYENLLVAKTLETSSEDLDRVRKRLSEMEQEIEYCITLLIK